MNAKGCDYNGDRAAVPSPKKQPCYSLNKCVSFVTFQELGYDPLVGPSAEFGNHWLIIS